MRQCSSPAVVSRPILQYRGSAPDHHMGATVWCMFSLHVQTLKSATVCQSGCALQSFPLPFLRSSSLLPPFDHATLFPKNLCWTAACRLTAGLLQRFIASGTMPHCSQCMVPASLHIIHAQQQCMTDECCTSIVAQPGCKATLHSIIA